MGKTCLRRDVDRALDRVCTHKPLCPVGRRPQAPPHSGISGILAKELSSPDKQARIVVLFSWGCYIKLYTGRALNNAQHTIGSINVCDCLLLQS